MSTRAPMSLQRIAYEVREVCNGVELSAIEAAIARTGLGSGATAIDIGTGNATVAIRLAQRFDLSVAAVELDPVMAELARSRIEAADASRRVSLTVARAAEMLARTEPVDLIVALGTTDVSGEGRPTPEAGFIALRRCLKPGGWLLWGDVVWRAEPPAPLRQITEVTNQYTDDAARVWVEAHPEAPEAPSIAFNADRVQAIMEFGRNYIGFGLYLLRNPD